MTTPVLDPMALLGLFGHCMVLSLLAIGGAIAAVPDLHRYTVLEQHWLTDTQFTSSIALSQAAPGPNLLFIAAIGWNVAGLVGVSVMMLGILLPSTVFTVAIFRWGHARRESLGVRSFTTGMAPLTIGMILSSGLVLSEPSRGSVGAVALVALTALAILRTRVNPLWLIATGALVGALGWV